VALEQFKTQVLLLHSEQSTLDALGAGFGDRYSVHYATTGTEALNTLGEVPIHVIVSAQNLPGMSGLEALREARKRSPDTIGILLAGSDRADGLEALVGDKEVFQVVRGSVTPDALIKLIETATRRVRLMTLAESANDTAADVDEPSIESSDEHIVMETAENGASIISDGTGRMPVLKPKRIQASPHAGGREVNVLVLTKDAEFLKTIRESSRGTHDIHHATTTNQAQKILRNHKVGVLVTDAAVAGTKIQVLMQALRTDAQRLVAVVAGRRDDGEQLMELINKGQVYRFLMKPVSPGRARLAIEASVKYHLDAPDSVFRSQTAAPAAQAGPVQRPPPVVQAAPVQRPRAAPKKPAPQPQPRPAPAAPQAPPVSASRSSLADSGRRIAPVIGRPPAGGNAVPAENAPNPMTLNAADKGGKSPGRMPLFAGAGVVTVIAMISIWSLFGDSPEGPAETPTPTDASTVVAPVADAATNNERDVAGETLRRPAVTESDVPMIRREPAAAPAEVAAVPAPGGLLEDARLARDAGEIIAPPGDNAVERYIAARDAFPDNDTIAAELAALMDTVYGMAESALLDNRPADAAAALNMVALVDAGSPRLAFLNAQLAQMQLRSALDGTRSAIREGRFEDAGRLLNRAQGYAGANTAEVNQLAEDLAQARSAQQVDEVLALAGERLDTDQLMTPSNDNARYYFELALNNDPNNTTAQQGLDAIASKLVLRARAAIDAGSLDDAEALLDDARALDPASADIEASLAALEAARERIAEAERQDATERAEAARQTAARQEAARRAEAERIADLARHESEAAPTAVTTTDDTADDTDTIDTGGTDGAGSLDNGPAARAGRAAGEPGSLPIDTPGSGLTSTPVESSSAEPERTNATDNDERAASDAEMASYGAGDEIVAISSLTRVNYVAPTYPRSARRRDISGWVDIAFTVSPQGNVTNIDILESTPGSIFDNAARDAIAEWRFDPVIENGVAVPKRVAVRMSFTLE